MTTTVARSQPTQTTQARTAARICFVVCGVGLSTAGFDLYLGLQTGAWQMLGLAAVALLIAVLSFAGAILSRRGFGRAGTGLLLGVLLVGLALTGALVANTGSAIGLIAPIIALLIATPTLSQRGIHLAVLAGLASGVVAGAFDVLALPTKVVIPAFEAYVPLISLTSLPIYAFFVTQQFRTYSLSIKLMIVLVSVGMVSISAVSFFVDRSNRTILVAEAGANLKRQAQAQAVTLGDLLARQVATLETLASNRIVQDGVQTINDRYTGDSFASHVEVLRLERQWRAADVTNNDADPLVQSRLNNTMALELGEYLRLFSDNTEVFVADQYGAVSALTQRVTHYNQSDSVWWLAAYNNGRGGVFIGEPKFDAATGTFAADVGVPVYAENSSTAIGAVHATYHFRTLTNLLSTADLGQTVRAALYLPGNLQIRAIGQMVEPVNLGSDLLSSLRAATGADYVEFEDEGVPRLISYAPVVASSGEPAVAGLGWGVLVQQERAESLAVADTQNREVRLVALIIASLMTVIALAVGQFLAGPITRLTTVARQITAGNLAVQARTESNDEIGELATAFNTMTAQLRLLINSLEARVEARTEQVLTSADVGRAAASILDVTQLLRQVVSLITDRFGFYYAAVFLIDDVGRFAVLREATGEAGQILKDSHYRLEVGGQSMVGSAIASRRPRIALNAAEETVRFANPLLPDTRSEIALPLMVGERVLGALDVQSTQTGAFDQAGAAVLQAMADQIAIALNNAEQFQRSEHQAKAQADLNHLSRNLFSSADADVLYRMLASQVAVIVPHDYLSLALHESEGSVLREYELHAEAEPVASETRTRLMTNTLIGRAFATRKSAVSLDADPETRTLSDVNDLTRSEFRSALSVPLLLGDQVLGTINFASRLPGTYLANVVAQAEQVAGQVAVALENMRLAEAQRRSVKEFESLTRHLTSQAWAEQFKRLPEGIQDMPFARNGLRVVKNDWLPEVELAIASMKPVAWAQRQEQTIVSPSQAAMAAPIVLHGEVIGALQVGEVSQPRAWRPEDLAFIQAVADQVALAVENARLLEQTQRTAQREKVVAEAADKIHRSNDLEAILRTALEEVSRILGTTEVSIGLGTGSPAPRNGGGNGHVSHPNGEG